MSEEACLEGGPFHTGRSRAHVSVAAFTA